MSNKILKVVSILITSGIIILLIFTGPAEAFILGIKIPNPYARSGDTVVFSVSSVFSSNEIVSLNRFKIELNGPENISCEFYPNMSKIGNCDGLNIKQISLPQLNFGYGYDGSLGYGYNAGYGYNNFGNGTLSFNISFNTKAHRPGIYSTKFTLITGNNKFSEYGGTIIVFNATELRGCSIRARDGLLSGSLINNPEDNEDKNNNRLSFNIPLENAVSGHGSFSAQTNKERIIYDFEVLGVIENNAQKALILTRGNYQINRIRNNTLSDLVLINLDKKNKEISIAGKKIDVSNMDVTLMRNCK